VDTCTLLQEFNSILPAATPLAGLGMIKILQLAAPLFAIIFLGWIAKRRELLDAREVAGINSFTYWIALPALLFGAILETDTANGLNVAGIYLACCLFIYAIAIAGGYFILGAKLARTAVFGLNASYGNVIFLGTPLVAAVFGTDGVSVILTIIALHSGVLLPLAAVLIELGSSRRSGIGVMLRNTIVGLLRNPIIMSIALGYLWRVSAPTVSAPGPELTSRLDEALMPYAVWQVAAQTLSPPIHQFLSLLGRAASPLALFCLGASLPPIVARSEAFYEAASATVLKLTVLPSALAS
jgi:malonate transporter and related proteins